MARVKLFAALRDIAGVSEDDIPATTVAQLIDEAVARFGDSFAGSLKYSKVAVNGILISELQGDETSLKPEDEVAFLPPVSGGG